MSFCSRPCFECHPKSFHFTMPKAVDVAGRHPPDDSQTISAAPADAPAPADTNPDSGEQASGDAEDADKKISKEGNEILNHIVSFHPFTEDSYRVLVEREAADKARAEDRAARAQEAHLVDGELIFGGEQEEGEKPPPKNPDLREGNVLRDEYGVCPPAYFGKPLEEIDKGIRDKVGVVRVYVVVLVRHCLCVILLLLLFESGDNGDDGT